MFAMIGATVFFGAALFAVLVMTRMVQGYWSLIVAALNGEPLPRTMASAPRVVYRPRAIGMAALSSGFTPQRLARQPHAPGRVAA
jgi:hypothetical protein